MPRVSALERERAEERWYWRLSERLSSLPFDEVVEFPMLDEYMAVDFKLVVGDQEFFISIQGRWFLHDKGARPAVEKRRRLLQDCFYLELPLDTLDNAVQDIRLWVVNELLKLEMNDEASKFL